MSKEPLKAFQCPSCGAPLQTKEGAQTARCDYCKTTVRIPREPRPSANREQGHSPRIPEARNDALPDDSEDKKMWQQLIILFIAVVFFVLFSLAKASKPTYRPAPTVYVPPTRTSTVPPPSFAKHLLTFNADKINPGHFSHASHLTVDKNGKVIVTDQNSGRFSIQDPNGNYLSTVSTGQSSSTNSIAANLDGQVLFVHGFKIHFYDSEGRETKVMADQYFSDVVVGPNGLIYTVSREHTISRYNQDGTVDIQIPNVFENFSDRPEWRTRLAVDKPGNMYLLGEKSAYIFKFAPDGTLLAQFGGTYHADAVTPKPPGSTPAYFPTQQPGTFYLPSGIAVDAYGRVYVGDRYGVTVFDADHQYKAFFITTEEMLCNDLAFDNEGHLYVLTDENTVEKYEVPKP